MAKLPVSAEKFTWRKVAPFAAAAATIGLVIVIAIQAAGTPIAFESETGTLANGATLAAVTGQSGTGAVKFATPATGSCTNSLSCWPNAGNTGYQNAPGYPGTPGVADNTKLTRASASSTACPLAFESHHTYKFCYYPGSMQIGSAQYPGDPDVGQHLTDVHFIGFLVEDSNPTSDGTAIMAYCKSDWMSLLLCTARRIPKAMPPS
jgi:hypothetical protein